MKPIRFFAAAAVLSVTASALAQDDPPSAHIVVQPAIDGVFEAFEHHRLVGLGDAHGLAEGMDFYTAIVSDPRFARNVGHVVAEFGASARQDVVDRYLAGETVTYEELRTVWTDTVGWVPTAGNAGFAKFFAAVRKANRELPSKDRIRVWLGEPPLDWSTATADDLMGAVRRRDAYPGGIIKQNILAAGERLS